MIEREIIGKMVEREIRGERPGRAARRRACRLARIPLV